MKNSKGNIQIADFLREIFLLVHNRIFLLVILLLLLFYQENGSFKAEAISLEENGPRFLEDWPSIFSYSSRVGGKIACRAHGQPKPTMQWVTNDFFPVSNITSVREVDEEGTLLFSPFEPEKYRAEVHAASYRCRASNPIGSIISPEIRMRAVSDTPFEIENRDVSILRGNIAVLRCTVPEQLRDFVSVTSWVQDSTVNIYPNFQTGKYSMLPNGDLYVLNVEASDGYKTFTCRTSHKLTNEAKTSQSSRIIVKDSESSEPVHLSVPKQTVIKVKAGEDIYLPCLAQGIPPPSYSWFRERDGILSDLLVGKTRNPSHLGPILLTQVRADDSGTYVCRVNNSISHEAARIKLSVYVPLRVQVSPNTQVVDVGRGATFRCLVSGSPVDTIEWYKDGTKISANGHGTRLETRYVISPRDSLLVASVHPEDSGMYQCFAHNNLYAAQDAAQLRLGSILPELVYRFSEQTLQPGPSVSLKCTAVGNPPPQFQWTLDGFPLPESERFLVGQYVTIHDNVISHVNITNVRDEDGGLFTCQAKNAMGTVSHSGRLNIYGPPFIRAIPPIKAVAGKHLQIQCPVSGYPIENISWERGGSLLPVNRMQRVYPNGTLIIEHIQKGTDEGIYTCQAKNRQGLSSTRDIHVRVIVPPKIMPFQFMNQLLREGMRAAVSCQVLEGDRPIDFVWEFENRPISLPKSHGVTIRIPDEYSSTLVIESLSSSHNGQYTCIAENSAGREHHSTELTVNVPPKWTLEPRDINVSAGQSIALHCQAEGHPTPSIVWKRATGTQPGEYKDLSGTTTGIYSNGSIRFEEIKKSDEGMYLCEARNGVGSGLSKVVFLKVNAPAQFADRDQQISVRAGEKAILQCRAKGDLPIDIQWSNKHAKIVSHSNHRYTVRQQSLEDGAMSELLVGDVGRSDSGSYNCRATNSFGTDQTSVMLNVQEPPEQPVNLRLLEQQSRSIQISWLESFNGNSPLINFIIQYKFPSETWTEAEVEELAVPASQMSAVVDGLSPSTTYHLRVLAQNGMGFSPPSEVIQITTAEEAPEGPPMDIEIEPMTSTKLKVRWNPPERHLWHGNILGYYLGFRELSLALSVDTGIHGESTTPHFSSHMPSFGDMHGYHFKTVEVGIDFGGETVIDNLRKFARYALLVQAFNAKGTGPASNPVVGTTQQDVPTISPEKISCSATTSQSLQITWEDPPIEGRNGVIQGYRLTHQISDDNYLESDAESGLPETKLTTTKSTSVHGLKRWTNYSISVLAFTSAGDGKISDSLICRTDEDVPSVPGSIKALVSSKRSILVSWLPPNEPNGVIEKYTVYMKVVDTIKMEKKVVQSHELTSEAMGLKENQLYEFWVTASTKVGEGGPTARVRTQTTNKVPSKIASFSQTVEVAWKRDLTLLCDSVGIPEPNILWKFNGNYIDYGTRKDVNSIGTLTIQEVATTDGGNYSCFSSNSHGSDSISYYVKVQVPPQAPVLQITETSYEALRLSWSAFDNGGSPIKGYVMNYKREGGDWEEYEVGPRTTSHVLQGLACGTKYQVYIKAFNKIGSGLASDVLSGNTKGNVPSAPKSQDIFHGNHSSITIKLDLWNEMGCPILRYFVEYKPAHEKNWFRIPTELSGETKHYTITGLHPSTKYDVRVTAGNNAGNSIVRYEFLTASLRNGENLSGKADSEVSRDDETPSSSQLSASLLIVLPIILSLLTVTGVIAFMCYMRRKRVGVNGPKTVIGDTPGGLQTLMHTQNLRNREEQHYCVVKSSDQPLHEDPIRYKTIDSADYIDDICPYATFQLPEKPPGRPLLTKGGSKKKFGRHTGDTMYNVGNIYSGPYHSVQSPGFLYNQATIQLREPEYTKVRRKGKDFESQESDNMASTDSEVKKILTLHMPISEYDTLGSDSEGEKHHQNCSPIHHMPRHLQPNSNPMQIQHEMVTFRQRQRSDPVITSDHSSSSTDSSPTGGPRKSSYMSRKSKSKSSVQSGSSAKQRVRSSSGYSSHTEETSFRIQPPTRFSDPRELSDGDEDCYYDGMEPSGLKFTMSSSKRPHKSRHSGSLHHTKKGGIVGREATYHIDV